MQKSLDSRLRGNDRPYEIRDHLRQSASKIAFIMTVKILYFAGLRETLGAASEEMVLPAQVVTAGALLTHLAVRGGVWATLAQTKNLRMAVNQDMAVSDTTLKDGDEVAFFPPVTGG